MQGGLRILRVGTRSSDLAVRQSEEVIARLREMYPEIKFQLVMIKTTGDKYLELPLNKIGDKGLFTKELEIALQQEAIDIAVHSLKDLPTELPAGCALGAVCRRERTEDVLVSSKGLKLNELPAGAQIGTSSLRRQAQLKNFRPDLNFKVLRGNVPTRLRKMEEEGLDAVIVAAAGLRRLGMENRITEYISSDICLPAVGQGALGIEVREGDEETISLLRPLHDEETALAVAAERSFLRALGGGCQVPIGALGLFEGERLVLKGMIAALGGEEVLRGERFGDKPTLEKAMQLGAELAEELLEQGGRSILKQIELSATKVN